MPNQPPLRRVHSDATLETGFYRLSLDHWRRQPTEVIVQSLMSRPADPSYQEYLKVRDDGLIFQGNTRVKVLEERGYNVNGLPRYPIA